MAKATKSEKGAILDAVCQLTGWHRDHARKAIRIALTERVNGPAPAHREDVPRLGPCPVLHPGTHPAGATHPGMDRSQGEPGCLRTLRDRQNVPARSARVSKPSSRAFHVARFTREQLGVLLRRHRAADTVTKAFARILRADLVVVDDIGLLSVATDAAEGLYRLVDAAYQKRSVAISSNLHPAVFDELMPKTLATATVDRLLHHAHVCPTSGDSVRLTQALAGKGVNP